MFEDHKTNKNYSAFNIFQPTGWVNHEIWI